MRRVVSVILALLAAGLLAAGWYVYDKGFTKKWRAFVTEEFRKRGVELSLRKLTLEPFRGIVAKEVKIYDTRERRRTLAVVDEMLLVINYANLINRRPFLDALDLRDARLELPLDAKNPRGPRLEVSKLSGRLFLPPQQIHLSRLDAVLYGIRVSASGRLINPGAFQPKDRDASSTGAVKLAGQIIEELKALKFEAAPPQIVVRFSGDLAAPHEIFAEATLLAEKVRRKRYRLETISMSASYRDGLIELKDLAATDARRGALSASGSFEPATRSMALRMRSTLDVQGFADAIGFGPSLEDITFHDLPRLELAADATLAREPAIRVLGRIAAGRFDYRSAGFDGLSADFSWNDGRWSARDVRLVHRSGEIAGDAMQLPGEFRARLRSTIDPRAFTPLLDGKAAEVFAQFEFRDPPAIDAEVRGTEPKLDALTATAAVKLGRTRFRDQPAENLTASLRYAGRRLAIEQFQLLRSEGSATGALTFDFPRNEVHLDKIRASITPAEVMLWIEPKIVKDVAPYRFTKRPPNLFIDGIVNTKRGGKTTRLNIDVDAPSGMNYTFLKRELSFPQVVGKLRFSDERLRISDLSASLFGGRLRGGADISIVRDRPGHSVELQLDEVDFASLTKLYFNYDDSKGRLDATYAFTGRGDDARTMKGSGQLAVHDGNIFAIPFLGPLSGILNSIVPNLGHDVARKATATFSVEDGVITTDDFVVEGLGFSMIGGGKLMFLDDKMDFSMRINAKGLPGVLLFPVSKLFEYVADDKLSKPKWRPKALPRIGG